MLDFLLKVIIGSAAIASVGLLVCVYAFRLFLIVLVVVFELLFNLFFG